MSVGFHQLEVAEVRRETPDAVSLRLTVPDDLGEAFAFVPGQHLTLRAMIDGADVRRNYSICSAPHERELRVAIKRIAGGVFSGWANRDLQAGARIEVLPPHGSFRHDFSASGAGTSLGIAGGSGITPILSLAKAALHDSPTARFVLLYGNRAAIDIMFLEEIAALKDRYMDRFQVFHFLEDEEGDLDLFNGRLDREKIGDVLGTLVDPAAIDRAFICGPGPMMDAACAGLEAAGVAADRIMVERFTVDELSEAQRSAREALQRQAEGKTMRLRIDGRRRTLNYDGARGSILENAQAAGLPVPFACKAGVCATCRAKVVSGKVEMLRNFGLVEADLAAGYVLTCQSIPLSDEVELDYDA